MQISRVAPDEAVKCAECGVSTFSKDGRTLPADDFRHVAFGPRNHTVVHTLCLVCCMRVGNALFTER